MDMKPFVDFFFVGYQQEVNIYHPNFKLNYNILFHVKIHGFNFIFLIRETRNPQLKYFNVNIYFNTRIIK